MDISHTSALERIARVLASRKLSSNANGDTRSAGDDVDQSWPDYLADAAAVLKALREPDARMASVGDAEIWTRMVHAGLDEDGHAVTAQTHSQAGGQEIDQKPLG